MQREEEYEQYIDRAAEHTGLQITVLAVTTSRSTELRRFNPGCVIEVRARGRMLKGERLIVLDQALACSELSTPLLSTPTHVPPSTIITIATWILNAMTLMVFGTETQHLRTLEER